jgi:tRNA(Ile)-lysidine synthase
MYAMLDLESFKQFWGKNFSDISIHNTHFIIGVSGGVDSIVLTHLMHTLQADFTIAHVNFQLRGAESVRDENFVRNFATQLKIPIEVHTCETAKYAETNKMGIQHAAREIRYAWFFSLIESTTIKEKKPVVLLTAHHANDQVETILMHLFRGTGIHGLTGIPIRRADVVNIIRPLLFFNKAAIKTYAKFNGLHYVEDSSNEKEDYTRNLIRLNILPTLETIFPMVNENILATAERIKEAQKIVNESVDLFWKKGLKQKKGIPSIAIDYWEKIKGNGTYTWGLIKKYGFKPQQIEEVHKLLVAGKGAYIAGESYKLIHWDGHIQIVNIHSQKYFLTIPKSTENLKIELGMLTFEWIEGGLVDIDKDPHFAYVDAQKIEWPLLLRSWEPTDYFYPLGLRKKKKLNHFLGSLKLSPKHKEQTLVLCTGTRIFWIVGKRIDDRFKISPATQTVLKISWQEIM